MKKTIVLAGVLAVLLGCWLATSPGNDSTEHGSAAASPFKGGVIVVQMKGGDGDFLILENPATHELCERKFLVGTDTDDGSPGNWMKGQRAWIPVDCVETIVEFADIEKFKKAGPQPEDADPRKPNKSTCVE